MELESTITFEDNFSQQADLYARYRPGYPPELFAYLRDCVVSHELAWDCATGNGQAAIGLADHFENVIATDPSSTQLQNAVRHERIQYLTAPAEQSPVEDGSLDLITVAQALHWFDLPVFFSEVNRTLKATGVLAVWCYYDKYITPEIDDLICHYRDVVVGPFWSEKVELVRNLYRDVEFPFEEWWAPDFAVRTRWTFDDVIGYLQSWSSTQAYRRAYGKEPVDEVRPALLEAWAPPSTVREVVWPLHMRVGRTR